MSGHFLSFLVSYWNNLRKRRRWRRGKNQKIKQLPVKVKMPETLQAWILFVFCMISGESTIAKAEKKKTRNSERNVRSSSPPYMSVPKKLKEKKVSNWYLQQHSAKSIDKDLDGSNLNYDRTACTYVGFRHLY